MYCISLKHLNWYDDRSCFMDSNDKSYNNKKKYAHYFTNCFTYHYENIITNMELYLSTCVCLQFIRGLLCSKLFGHLKNYWDNYISAEKNLLVTEEGWEWLMKNFRV